MGQARRRGEEAGSLSLETVTVAPVILLFYTFVLAVGTLQNDRGTMDAAAQAAARQASITRPSNAPITAGEAAADAVLAGQNLAQCKGTVTVRPFRTGPVKPGAYDSVTARGSCKVRIDFGVFSLTEPVTSSFTSVVDTYRGQ